MRRFHTLTFFGDTSPDKFSAVREHKLTTFNGERL